jgi:uncharacterized membrane protein YGL010W
MKTLAEHMAVYGTYHRDRRNKITHFIGVPLIVFSLLIPMAWLRLKLGEVEVSAAMLFVLAVLIYYFALDAVLAAAMAVLSAVLLFFAERVASLPLGISATVFAVTFILGWIIQLVGHAFEGRKPALLDNLFQVLVAPIFLMAELFFALGAKHALREEVEVLMRKNERQSTKNRL